ncbi:hypothetical protein BDZ88DRAFT_199502 [Geranomyces variabilis]|nr:hypothetical protein BDZ88DRAFT_199502 [Geranomyces variabilis]KAJ3133560.1 hypothetical protein HDU90_005638 [Geranomyces variabilis]
MESILHFFKVFWYTGSMSLALVQGFRIEFILIAFNRPRYWSRYIVLALLSMCGVLGLLSVAIFFIGVTRGLAATPFHFGLPYVGGYVIVGLTDIGLSIALLSLFANYTTVMQTLDTLSLTSSSSNDEHVRRFVLLNRVPAIVQLLGDVFFAFCYFIGALSSGGYTYSLMSTLGPPLQHLFLLYSVECMKRAQSQFGKISEETGTSDSHSPAPAKLKPVSKAHRPCLSPTDKPGD